MTDVASPSIVRERTRLHITPLTSELYDRVIPPSLRPLVSDISFHTLQTFPERAYGFVELPTMEAQKLKKKLNGSTLKGAKMAVEEAKPVKKRKSSMVEEDDGESERKRAKRGRKEKRKEEHGVLAGHELEEGRRVKRGWTGDESREKGKKKSKEKKGGKSKKDKSGADWSERKMRFKTAVPDNKKAAETERGKKKAKKDKKLKKGQTVVDEYSKRRKDSVDHPTVNTNGHGNTTYEEGKGWVDEAGEVVEAERKSKRRKEKVASPPRAPSESGSEQVVAGAMQEDSVGEDDEEISNDEDAQPVAVEEKPSPEGQQDSKISDSSDDFQSALESPVKAANEVHPLEALFKRSAQTATTPTTGTRVNDTTPTRPRPAPIDTSFSFFGAGDAGDEDVDADDAEMRDANLPPATPHTKQDLEWRSLRSAAPTPDTAAIGRKFSLPFARGLDEEDEVEDDEEGEGEVAQGDARVMPTAGEGRGEESAFRKWFFENRGDLNRGWRKRRREERKVARQRENRRLGRKVA